ncbi:MAG TPA: ATPase domain-containing protein [Actinomycetota bacterium]|nr:ATPase domain-containing protein [Actinomycetota bacterium]
MGKVRTFLTCSECGQQVAQWVGRCPGCAGWGTIEERGPSGAAGSANVPVPFQTLAHDPEHEERRVASGFPGIDRVLGGGLVPASVTLLAGEPGIGKSTLLLQLVANLSIAGLPCLLASGEESRGQVAARARRLAISGEVISFVPGRDLGTVLSAARGAGPFLLAVDSIQTLRDTEGGQIPGGPSQVRGCTDALVGLAKGEGIAVVLAGHVTKDGDLAGPRTLEHVVDAVLTFDGDPRNGLRMLSGGKNRFGQEGEVAWFEMTGQGLREIDPSDLLRSGEREPGSATALPVAGRRGLAVEVQALVAPGDGPARRQATGLDPRRFQLVAAVLDRAMGVPLGRAELYGASLGGVRIDDPACDLAVAAALVSAATGVPPPARSAFVGEIGLTGRVRPAAAMPQRLAAARAAGCSTVIAAGDPTPLAGVRTVPVRHVQDALAWAGSRRASGRPGSLRAPGTQASISRDQASDLRK